MSKVVDVHGGVPEYDVYIGRRVPFHPVYKFDSKWANPFRVKEYGLKKSLELYELYIRKKIKEQPEYLEELRGKKLGCWCVTTDEIEPTVCHGQILMKLLQENLSDSL